MLTTMAFILNSLGLFIFPPLGHLFEMTQQQFGTWAAIAIHDTSSVVGAGEAYGEEALQTATLIKLTRALWIIPLAIATMFIFRDKTARTDHDKEAVVHGNYACRHSCCHGQRRITAENARKHGATQFREPRKAKIR